MSSKSDMDSEPTSTPMARTAKGIRSASVSRALTADRAEALRRGSSTSQRLTKSRGELLEHDSRQRTHVEGIELDQVAGAADGRVGQLDWSSSVAAGAVELGA